MSREQERTFTVNDEHIRAESPERAAMKYMLMRKRLTVDVDGVR
jgi:hypothetical protein